MLKSSLLLFFLFLAGTGFTECDVILIRFYNLNLGRIDIFISYKDVLGNESSFSKPIMPIIKNGRFQNPWPADVKGFTDIVKWGLFGEKKTNLPKNESVIQTYIYTKLRSKVCYKTF